MRGFGLWVLRFVAIRWFGTTGRAICTSSLLVAIAAGVISEPSARDRFLKILDQVRARWQFRLVGYVIMPEYGLIEIDSA